MCGIVGYAGKRQAAPILLDGLQRLEYRGYDSAGICIHTGGVLSPIKSCGRLQALRERIGDVDALRGSVGIGHTRWATHGAPSDINSHPHASQDGSICIVHNGIIENEARLRAWLEERGVCFRSQTDSEVMANLVAFYYRGNRDFLAAVRQALAQIEGSYAFAILCADEPQKIICAKKDSPLIFGFGDGEQFVASDVPAILKYTDTVAYLDDGELAVFTADKVDFYDCFGHSVEKRREKIRWALSDAERGGFDHFMLKEIFDQPQALRDTIHPRIRQGRIELDGIDLSPAYLKGLCKICLVACGSSYYVATLAKLLFEKYCGISAEAVTASEFRYAAPAIDGRDLVIAISQSGETADTLAALREAQRLGARTLAIVNVVGSAIAKAAEQTVYTWAGPEIAVATTKAFTTQLAVIDLLVLDFARKCGRISEEDYAAHLRGLQALPETVASMLTQEKLTEIRALARRYSPYHDAFFIGRNLDSAICMEASLKLKELAYMHSEAYPAGELKHGPIALIENGTPVVALATAEELFDKTMSNIRAVTARGARVLCVTRDTLRQQAQTQVNDVLTVPSVLPMLQPGVTLVPMQLFAYFVAVERQCDVDKPRNLAKSVTVE